LFRRKQLGGNDRSFVEYKDIFFKRTYENENSVQIGWMIFHSPDGTSTWIDIEDGKASKVCCEHPGEKRSDMVPRQRRVFDVKANDYRRGCSHYLDLIFTT
jgi:hypothetical protein